ncbi:MAG: serine hydrolase domain-containing protein, partial [Woeseiaceae bacterium]
MSSPIPLIIAFVVAVLTSACDAQESTSVGTADPKLIEVRDRIVHRIESGELPSVSVAVARNGKVVWMESFGWQDIENRIPATPKTVYAIGSIAKSKTATGVMVQVDAGKLNLNQRIVEVIGRDALQSYGGSASQITLRDVLSMTAGIPHG